jgi:hypothetical protein
VCRHCLTRLEVAPEASAAPAPPASLGVTAAAPEEESPASRSASSASGLASSDAAPIAGFTGPDKKCPKCGLWNPGSSIQCDCGYDFVTKKVHRLARQVDRRAERVSLTKRALLISAILTTGAFISIGLRSLDGSVAGAQLVGSLLLGIPGSFVIFFILGLPIALVERELSKRFSRSTVLLGLAGATLLGCILLSAITLLIGWWMS